MKLNLRQIEVFRAVMLTGSVVGASKLLYVSQPAISRLIAHTEQRLGFELFLRTKGRLYPTPEARRLLSEVNVVYEGVERVNEVADDLAANRTGSLRISCSPNVAQTALPRAVAQFREAHPDVRVVVRSQIPSNMLQVLLSGQVDLAVSNMPIVHPNLTSQLLVKNPIVALIPEGHRLSTRAWVRPDELVGEDLIGYREHVPFGLLIHEIFAAMGEQPEMQMEVDQAQIARAMAQVGAGIALVDALTVFGETTTGCVAVPVRTKVNASVQIFHLQTEALSRLAQAFVGMLEGVIAPAGGRK
ncbi:LysR family transcriptional regulator [Imbroritus primus]|uniref:LysR family transcriptional regulator n=1 Tax=Imbroritus primus TaxID=3058603 RepID=A0ACD3SNW1_9BURK|nr:LysR family transcriptional regulator [Burkholderiaceae bacterium PBA]